MIIHAGIYHYQNRFYTGTDIQPDTLSIFVKFKDDKESFHVRHKHAYANCMGYVPILGSFTGVARIVNAVKSIFNHLSQLKFKSDDPHLNECWNAFKNLFRGLVEVVPFLGITLIIFDVVRNVVFMTKKIQKELKEEKGVAGVAIDGKIVFTIDIEQLDEFLDRIHKDKKSGKVKTDRYRLDHFSYLCSEFLEQMQKKGSKSSLSELLPKIREIFFEKKS